MTTTIFAFNPDPQQVYTFLPTFDGVTYSCSVTWNLFAQRYYLNCDSLNGVRVFSQPLIGSPTGTNLQSATWKNGKAIFTAAAEHGFKIGETIDLTISGCTPDTYNGLRRCFIVDKFRFSFSLPEPELDATALGVVNYNINLLWAYFNTTAMVYRPAARQFEVMN